jgi:hypothetical protein
MNLVRPVRQALPGHAVKLTGPERDDSLPETAHLADLDILVMLRNVIGERRLNTNSRLCPESAKSSNPENHPMCGRGNVINCLDIDPFSCHLIGFE